MTNIGSVLLPAHLSFAFNGGFSLLLAFTYVRDNLALTVTTFSILNFTLAVHQYLAPLALRVYLLQKKAISLTFMAAGYPLCKPFHGGPSPCNTPWPHACTAFTHAHVHTLERVVCFGRTYAPPTHLHTLTFTQRSELFWPQPHMHRQQTCTHSQRHAGVSCFGRTYAPERINIILNSATLNTFLLAPSSAGRGGRTISGKQRIGFGAAAGAQQLYGNITQARSGTATPLNSKAHITARGTFDG